MQSHQADGAHWIWSPTYDPSFPFRYVYVDQNNHPVSGVPSYYSTSQSASTTTPAALTSPLLPTQFLHGSGAPLLGGSHNPIYDCFGGIYAPSNPTMAASYPLVTSPGETTSMATSPGPSTLLLASPAHPSGQNCPRHNEVQDSG